MTRTGTLFLGMLGHPSLVPFGVAAQLCFKATASDAAVQAFNIMLRCFFGGEDMTIELLNNTDNERNG